MFRYFLSFSLRLIHQTGLAVNAKRALTSNSRLHGTGRRLRCTNVSVRRRRCCFQRRVFVRRGCRGTGWRYCCLHWACIKHNTLKQVAKKNTNWNEKNVCQKYVLTGAIYEILECGPMTYVMAAMPNIGARPLFNAAKFGWRPLLECRAVTMPRREHRWNLLGCPKLANKSQVLVVRSSSYCKDVWGR